MTGKTETDHEGNGVSERNRKIVIISQGSRTSDCSHDGRSLSGSITPLDTETSQSAELLNADRAGPPKISRLQRGQGSCENFLTQLDFGGIVVRTHPPSAGKMRFKEVRFFE